MKIHTKTIKIAELLKTDIIHYRNAKASGEIGACDFWRKIIKSKLQIVNIFGGNVLAQEIVTLMAQFDDEISKKNLKIYEEHEQNELEGIPSFDEEYHFEGAFDALATGVIDDWYS